ELVKTEDIEDMRKNQSLNIVSVVGREYDYIGWNNIDPELFTKENKIILHKLFGNKNVRIALSHAINNQEILEEYLLNYGEIAVSPVSKIFKRYFNPEIKAYQYNTETAKKLLAAEDWKDTNNNGILDKNNTEFRFTLYFPSGNPLRNYASTIIKNNLASIGIEMKIVNLEMGSFIDHLYEKKMDAWMAAWYIPIPVELKSYWYSDLEMTPLNFVSYQNKQADDIINELEQKISDKRKKDLYFKFQEIIHNDQPVTFLYWIPNITVYNKRIKNIHITPLGSITHCWEWKISD
ncbi:MAG TPA: ABC transporter substrate-binding protein, partial [Ignavibacteriaceae bacterium]|nr:ABC transporter substrate-binding protein [Ignavibacteriaceae bacterium]